MWWIALYASPPEGLPPERLDENIGWWALTFSPRVTRDHGLWLMEVEASMRLFGGRKPLWQRLLAGARVQGCSAVASAPNAVAAAALLRHLIGHTGQPGWACATVDALALPRVARAWGLECLPAALPHIDTLHRLGCRTVGDLLDLPRGGVARRWGAELPLALDQLLGRAPTVHRWITLPDTFDQRLELPGRIEHAPGMVFAARRLLQALGLWLQGRLGGAVAMVLHWQHDGRRHDTAADGGWGALELRTSAPTRDMAHLERVLGERLAQVRLNAPAIALRLQVTEWAPLAGISHSLLPDAAPAGAERAPQLLERLAARLGPERVRVGRLEADHRPDHQHHWQTWHPALPTSPAATPTNPQAMWQPCWLVDRPHPITAGSAMASPWQIETGWWQDSGDTLHGSRFEYLVMEDPRHGLVWAGRDLRQPHAPWRIHGHYG